ncbi:MAG: hypothetical protein WAU68_04165 [Vitreimonas sp.]
MRRFLLLSAAVAAVCLSACGLIAPAYPQFGETAYRVEGNTAAPDGGPVIHTVIYRQGSNLRVETVLPHYGRAIVVFDRATNAAYVLNPTIQPTTTSPNTPTTTLQSAPGAAPPVSVPQTTVPNAPVQGPTVVPAQPTPSGQLVTAVNPARVIGVAVRISDSDAPQPLETPWAALGGSNARSVGDCTVAGQNGHEWQPKEAPAPGVERTACITSDGVVLRVRENSRVLFEATNVQRGPQNASLFGVPPGYQTINPEAVAQGIGERMDQLNSVTGAPPQAALPAPHG